MTTVSESTDFFYTPALKGLMQQLVHLANFGDGFSVVLGPLGSGKTTVSHEIEKHFDGVHQLVRLNLSEGTELAESLALLADSFGLPQGDDLSVGELLSELRHFVQALAQDKKLLVLVVDNAHYFDDQAIGALVSLLQGGVESNFGLHLILFAEPGLEIRIDRLQILDIAVYDFEIPNLSPTEMSSFLDARNTSVQQLTTSQVQKIWSLSKGLPGPALRALNGQGTSSSTSDEGVYDTGSSTNNSERDAKGKIPIGHIAAIILLVCVLFWSIMWHAGGKDESLENNDNGLQDQTLASEQSPVFVPEKEQSSLDDAVGEEDEAEFNHIDAERKAGIERSDEALSTSEPLLANSEKALNDKQPSGSEAPPRKEDSLEKYSQSATSAAQSSDVDQNLTDVQPEEGGAELPSPASEEVSPAAEEASPKDEKDSDIAHQDEVIGIREAPSVVLNNDAYEQSLVTSESGGVDESAEPLKLTNDEAFILAQNPNFYALQVIAASKKESLEAYIARQPNRGKLRMYRGTREGKSWYVVVEGVYSTRDSAMKARILLPKEQAKAGPWPRLFSSIQEEIEMFRRQ